MKIGVTVYNLTLPVTFTGGPYSNCKVRLASYAGAIPPACPVPKSF